MRIVYCFRFHLAHEGVFALFFLLICISVVVDFVLHSSLRFRRYILRRFESVASFCTIFLMPWSFTDKVRNSSSADCISFVHFLSILLLFFARTVTLGRARLSSRTASNLWCTPK